jgi:ubiquinone/menaquinone biosynthesis C-methylase UbiE
MRTFKKSYLLLSIVVLMSCNNSGTKTDDAIDTTKCDTSVPIDCPMRKYGMDMKNMKPFADVEKYIEFLERADRAVWQKPDSVVSYMNLKGDETIADVGAGSGYFSFRFANALPEGKVVAIDIEPEMIMHIHHKTLASKIKNIEVVLAAADDPKVPAKANIVFICDVLHHLSNRAKWLATLYSEISKGTKLILIEFREGELPQGPPEKMKITSREMLTLMTVAGFTLIKKDSTLLPYQNYFEFEKK